MKHVKRTKTLIEVIIIKMNFYTKYTIEKEEVVIHNSEKLTNPTEKFALPDLTFSENVQGK